MPILANTVKNNPKYSGLYDGVVTSVADPLNQGRLQVKVPQLLGEQGRIWAKALQISGALTIQAIPPVGQEVKLWFQGKAEDCYWLGGSNRNGTVGDTDTVLIKDDKGNYITWQRNTGELYVKSKAKITLESAQAAVIKAPVIDLEGKVQCANGASGILSPLSVGVASMGIVTQVR